MTPARLGLLALSLVALIGAVWLVFVGVDLKPGPAATPVAALPSPTAAPTADQATEQPTDSPSSAPSAPGATEQPSAPTTPQPTPLDPLAKQVPPTTVEPDQLTGYVWPLRNALISGRFAPRLAAEGGFVVIDGVAYHDGLDLNTRCGDKVRAAHDGTVLYAGRDFDPYLGYQGDAEAIYARLEKQGRTNTQPIVIVIDDGNGYRSVYVHLAEADAEAGQVVKAGDIIGLEGMTGFATGCHLHYGMIRMDGPWQEVVARLQPYGYPPLVRERVNPLDVLPWGDEYAPQRLQDKVNPPSAGPESPTPAEPTPCTAPVDPGASPGPSPAGPEESPGC